MRRSDGALGRMSDSAVTAALEAVGFLPERAVYLLSDTLASMSYRLDRKRRRRGFSNLKFSLPNLSKSEREDVIKGCYRNLWRTGFELARSRRNFAPDRCVERVDIEGEELLDGCEPGRTGYVVISAHTGNWEVLGDRMASLGYSVAVVAREVSEGLVGRTLTRLRTAHRQRMVSAKGAVNEGRDILKSGTSLAFAADQHAAGNRIWVPFFYAPVAFVKTPAMLARRYGTPILIGFCRRVGPGYRFAVKVYPPIHPDPSLTTREDVARMTRTWVGYLESFVRENPEQFLWLHRQWRKPQDGDEFIRRDGTYVRSATFGDDPTKAM